MSAILIYFAAEVEFSSTCRYGAAIAAFALLIAYYTGEYSGQCKLHEFFASINLIICVALSVVSILPKVDIAARCSYSFKLYTLIGTPPFQGARAHAAVWPAAVRYGVPLHPLSYLVRRLQLAPG